MTRNDARRIQGNYWEIFRGVRTSWQINERLLDFRHVFTAKNNDVIFRADNFCKAKDNKREAEKDHYGIKAIKEISMQPLILLAVVSMLVLYVLIIVACLCYVGRHGARTS
jgi:hypothetical protein